MEPMTGIYDQYNQPQKVTVPKEVETMYYESYGHSPRKKFFRSIKHPKS